MSNDRSKSNKGTTASASKAFATVEPSVSATPKPAEGRKPPFFRRCDWISFAVTTLLVFIGYYLTLAPDLTLEDSGELAVGSYYAGVPHPPGYPVWTIYTWLFTVLIPVSNIAWRVALSSAVAAAFASGLLALIASRGSSMILESIEFFKNIDRKAENLICIVAGWVAGMLIGFNGFMWSQAVIVEVYTLSVLSLVATLVLLLRWLYEPERVRWLLWAFFLFGICFTNHQTLICAAMGIEVLICFGRPRLGRDLLLGNVLAYFFGVLLKATGLVDLFAGNTPVLIIFHVVGFLSLVAYVWLCVLTQKRLLELARDVGGYAMLGFVLSIPGVIAGFVEPQLADVPGALKLLLYLASAGGLLFALWWISKQTVFRVCFGTALAYLIAVVLTITGIENVASFSGLLQIAVSSIGIASLLFVMGYSVTRRETVSELWRELVRVDVFCYVIALLALPASYIGVSEGDLTLLYSLVGLSLLVGTWWLFRNTWKTVWDFLSPFFCGLAFLLGTSFYLYMPLASMTNPPMNWGYPRTVEGFIHAFTRGQYEKTNPTESIGKFAEQMWMLAEGLVSEFNIVFLLIAFVPLAFIGLMRNRERAWLFGQIAIYLCLSVLLIYLLNPAADKTSTDLTRVFFTASHVMVAMCVGYGVAIATSMLLLRSEEFHKYLTVGGVIAVLLALYGIAYNLQVSEFSLDRLRALFGLVITLALTLIILLARKKIPLIAFLVVVSIAPLYSVMAHWSDNERRGHLFGFWYGHDMFIPPFTDESGELSYDPEAREELLADPEAAKLIYPEMAQNAILFGGTDPGRFCPTYMIFCESFIDPEDRRNPNFDRRDVYIITQNALADHTYLSYIRAHYNRSTQIDPPFFQELLRPSDERDLDTRTNWLARTFGKPLDSFFTEWGAEIEEQRREEGVYPPEEIYTPTPLDSQISFERYLKDAGQRKRANQLKQGEQVDISRGPDGQERIQVAGQVSVMAINALLCRIIFDNNPTNEFYIEESFPLDWMFPHLTPFGIIMKINREPVGPFSEEIYQRDRHFWKEYSQRLIGNWINEDTSVEEICNFATRVFQRRDYTGFEGDPKFVRNDQAQKSFSKLRGAIAGLYVHKMSEVATGSPDWERALREAEFAYKQAFAFCPYSPEAAIRYAQLLINMPGRQRDALLIAETALSFDPKNEQFQYVVDTLMSLVAGGAGLGQTQGELNALIENFQRNPMEISNVQPIVSMFLQSGQTNEAVRVIQQVLAQPTLTPDMAVQLAVFGQELRNLELMEAALVRLTQVAPDSPEGWYDLASLRAAMQQDDQALSDLRRAVELSDARLQVDPGAADLRAAMEVEPRFASLRARADWGANFGSAPGNE